MYSNIFYMKNDAIKNYKVWFNLRKSLLSQKIIKLVSIFFIKRVYYGV